MAYNRIFDPSKTLFVTDLDGTFLTPEGNLPENAVARACSMAQRGIVLTFATARTIWSAASILSGMPFSAPISLMNGTFLRDMHKNVYLRRHTLDADTVQWVLTLGGEPFIYATDDTDQLFANYRCLANPWMESYYTERKNLYDKPFVHLGDNESPHGKIVYFCYLASHDALAPIREAALQNPLVQCAFYPQGEWNGLWYLEIFSSSASKGNAIRDLREVTGRQVIVAFGDNFNDLPMFAEADVAVTVKTAAPDIRNAADDITTEGSGVLDWIEAHVGE